MHSGAPDSEGVFGDSFDYTKGDVSLELLSYLLHPVVRYSGEYVDCNWLGPLLY